MRSKIIVLTGFCATGKSTFGRKLALTLGVPCFSKDTLKEAMADGFGSNSDLLRNKGSVATTRMMIHMAECCLQVGQTCILESNFRLAQGEWIKALVEKYNAECLTFLFLGDLNVLWDRYTQREPDRHWVHANAGENRESFVEGHLKAGIGEVSIGQTIRVDATAFENIDYEVLLAEAKTFLAKP